VLQLPWKRERKRESKLQEPKPMPKHQEREWIHRVASRDFLDTGEARSFLYESRGRP